MDANETTIEAPAEESIESMLARAAKIAQEIAEFQSDLINYKAETASRLARLQRIEAKTKQHKAAIVRGVEIIEAEIEQKSAEIAKIFDAIGAEDLSLVLNSRAATVKRQYAGGSRALILDENYKKEPAQLPEEFHKREILPDMEALRKALESGRELEFARLADRGFKISIKFAGGA